MVIGKSISLFLIDGTANGVVACELLNWTGKGYKIPRSRLKDISERKDLRKAGVYFLIGRDENDEESVYIGEAEEVYKRILQHQEKDFWSEAIAFISKDENLNKAHIKYLEYTLHKQAVEAGRYVVMNSNIPNCPAISEADQAVMTEFSHNLTLLMGTLGYKVLEKLALQTITKQEKYYIKAARGAESSAILTSEGIVVLKGSKIASTEVASMPVGFINKRNSVMKSGVVKDWKFVKDYLFSSPSTAAAVVMGRSANGLIEWKRKDGSTLKDNQATDKKR
ncbi:MAG: GIY-YIG nuclease family protein [Desulfobacteraceae bacterium]|nr:GIY-YIG nuclease family protein [Desulfobacteraceae bacterium]MBC2754341.1 GIY-YIG nuclease family protein [Desulfobacteraceae bacterium]